MQKEHQKVTIEESQITSETKTNDLLEKMKELSQLMMQI